METEREINRQVYRRHYYLSPLFHNAPDIEQIEKDLWVIGIMYESILGETVQIQMTDIVPTPATFVKMVSYQLELLEKDMHEEMKKGTDALPPITRKGEGFRSGRIDRESSEDAGAMG